MAFHVLDHFQVISLAQFNPSVLISHLIHPILVLAKTLNWKHGFGWSLFLFFPVLAFLPHVVGCLWISGIGQGEDG